MPTVEIDENYLINLRQLEGVAAKIMRNPEGKKLLEKAHKLVDAAALTPTLDQEAAIQEPVNKALERVAELEKKLADERAEKEHNDKLAALGRQESEGLAALRQQGWTDEGIDGVKKLMEEKGILDPLDAAAIFEKHHPPPPPANPSGHGAWGFMDNVNEGDKFIKGLIETKGEGNGLIDQEARLALAEIRGQSRR